MIQISLKNPSRQAAQKDTSEKLEPSHNVKTIASVHHHGKIQINLQKIRKNERTTEKLKNPLNLIHQRQSIPSSEHHSN